MLKSCNSLQLIQGFALLCCAICSRANGIKPGASMRHPKTGEEEST